MSKVLAPVFRGVRSAVRCVGRMYRLTDAVCRRAGPGRHADGACLYLVVRRTGTKSWVLLITVGDHRREYGLGGYPLVSLAEARELAEEYRSLIRKGVDPRTVRSSSAPTVREAFEEVIKDRSLNWTAPDAVKAYRARYKRHVDPALGGLRVDEVTVDQVYHLVRPRWAGRNSLGYHIRHQISHLMGWAVVHKHRADNPADLVRGLLPVVKSAGQYQPSLPYGKLPQAVSALNDLDVVPVIKLAILFLILTAGRLREVTEARWAEFDLEAGLWTVPSNRMKKRRQHRVPLSTQALRILAEARRLGPAGDLVFGYRNGRRPPRALQSNDINKVLRLLGLEDPDGRDAVAHGFRSTFTDWAADTEAVQDATADAALAHGAESDTRKRYRRTDLLVPRGPLMQAWADYVLPMQGE